MLGETRRTKRDTELDRAELRPVGRIALPVGTIVLACLAFAKLSKEFGIRHNKVVIKSKHLAKRSASPHNLPEHPHIACRRIVRLRAGRADAFQIVRAGSHDGIAFKRHAPVGRHEPVSPQAPAVYRISVGHGINLVVRVVGKPYHRTFAARAKEHRRIERDELSSTATAPHEPWRRSPGAWPGLRQIALACFQDFKRAARAVTRKAQLAARGGLYVLKSRKIRFGFVKGRRRRTRRPVECHAYGIYRVSNCDEGQFRAVRRIIYRSATREVDYRGA